MWKEELVELPSRAHADVGRMWGRTDSREREKLAIVADMCKVLVQHRAHNLFTLLALVC